MSRCSTLASRCAAMAAGLAVMLMGAPPSQAADLDDYGPPQGSYKDRWGDSGDYDSGPHRSDYRRSSSCVPRDVIRSRVPPSTCTSSTRRKGPRRSASSCGTSGSIPGHHARASSRAARPRFHCLASGVAAQSSLEASGPAALVKVIGMREW